MKRNLLVFMVIVLALVGTIGFYVANNKRSNITKPASNQKEQSVTQSDAEVTVFDKKKFSLTDPSSIWVIVNKKNSIPISFVPELTVPNVRLRLGQNEEQMKISTRVAPAVNEMFDSATKDGINLVFGSGYRSATKQQEFYNSYVTRDGRAAADTYSARPGHSEHQTGLAFDITSPSRSCHLEICWQDTPEGKWVATHAHKHGFIMRYPQNKQAITGYQYEPWHFRYVGKELATEIYNSQQTLEEFFSLPPAPNYD